MTLSMPRVRHYLRECNLAKLFIEELGWDRHSAQLAVAIETPNLVGPRHGPIVRRTKRIYYEANALVRP